jgi:hypothetical protein
MPFINGGRPTRARIEAMSYRRSRLLRRFAGYGFWAAIEKSTGNRRLVPLPAGEGRPSRRVELATGSARPPVVRYAAEGSRALIEKGFTDGVNVSSRTRWS